MWPLSSRSIITMFIKKSLMSSCQAAHIRCCQDKIGLPLNILINLKTIIVAIILMIFSKKSLMPSIWDDCW